MIWQELIIEKLLSASEIKKGLNAIFDVKADEILIVKDISEIDEFLGDNIRILCETWLAKTEFPFMITVCIRDEVLLNADKSLETDIYRICKFCEAINCQVIISERIIIFIAVNIIMKPLLNTGKINRKKVNFNDYHSMYEEAIS